MRKEQFDGSIVVYVVAAIEIYNNSITHTRMNIHIYIERANNNNNNLQQIQEAITHIAKQLTLK